MTWRPQQVKTRTFTKTTGNKKRAFGRTIQIFSFPLKQQLGWKKEYNSKCSNFGGRGLCHPKVFQIEWLTFLVNAWVSKWWRTCGSFSCRLILLFGVWPEWKGGACYSTASVSSAGCPLAFSAVFEALRRDKGHRISSLSRVTLFPFLAGNSVAQKLPSFSFSSVFYGSRSFVVKSRRDSNVTM